MRADEDDLRRWWWIFGFGLSLQCNHTYVRVVLYICVCMAVVCVFIACLYDVECLFCMRVGKRVYVCASSFFQQTLFLGVLSSPGSHMHVCIHVYECDETRHLNYLVLVLLLSSFFFLHHFICYFISIELAINAEPLFSFRIEPTFFHSTLCFFPVQLWRSSIVATWIQKPQIFQLQKEKNCPQSIHIDWLEINTQEPIRMQEKEEASIFHLDLCLSEGFCCAWMHVRYQISSSFLSN